MSLLSGAADRGPLLCVIDDAQWLDVLSGDALVFTARRIGAEGITMLFAAREGEARSFEARGIEELLVGRLDRESGLALLARSAPDAVAHVRDRLLVEADGNPLALLELPASLSEEQLGGRASLPENLPLTTRLRSTFIQRVERLPERARDALLVASASRSGELRVIRRAIAELGLGPDAFEPAEEIGLVRTSDGRFTFRHPLVHSAVYDSSGLLRR